MDSHLVGIDRLDATWRTLLPDVLATAAGCRGVVVDLRSPYYQAAGLPRGLGDRTVALRVGQHAAGGRRIGDVIAKRTRGEAAHALLECAEDPVEPGELAELLGDRWPVRLVEPEAPGKPWTMTLSVDA